jgi:hypothetical protein
MNLLNSFPWRFYQASPPAQDAQNFPLLDRAGSCTDGDDEYDVIEGDDYTLARSPAKGKWGPMNLPLPIRLLVAIILIALITFVAATAPNSAWRPSIHSRIALNHIRSPHNTPLAPP